MPRAPALPKELKKRRVKLGRTLRAAAEVSGLSNSRLCQMENATEEALLIVPWLTLQRICKAYDVTFAGLNRRLEHIAKRKRAL